MKQRFFERIGQWITPPCVRKCLTSLKALILLLVMGLSVNMWGATAGDVFSKITKVSDLADGDEIIFVNSDGTSAMSTTQNANNRGSVTITIKNGRWTYPTGTSTVQILTVKVVDGKYGFHTGSGYLYSASTSKNYLNTTTTPITTAPTTTSLWSLSIAESGNKNQTVTMQNGTNTAYYIQWNGTTVSQYKNTQANGCIYKKAPVIPVTSLILSEAGVEKSVLNGQNVGDTYELPSSDATCGDKEFVGWSSVEITTPGNKPTSNFYKPGDEVTLEDNNTFYAVFAEKKTETVTKEIKNLSFTAAEDVTYSTGDDNLEMHFLKGGSGTNPGNYNNGVRLYQAGSGKSFGGYITIESTTGNIMEVSFQNTNTYATSVKYSTDKGTTLSTAESVAKSGVIKKEGLSTKSFYLYNVGTTSSTRLEIDLITIKYEGGQYSNYTTSCAATGKTLISYNKNTEDEVTGDIPESVEQENGVAYTVSTVTLTRSGYIFKGWNTNKEATEGITTIPAASITGTAITLYAIWQAKTVQSVVVSGTPATFWKGDAFNHDGITVTANYDDATSEDVTAKATFSTPDMTSAGEKTITVTYNGKTDTYTINVQTIANTQATAYTVVQAKAIVDAGKDLATEVYVKGIVSSMISTYLPEGGGYLNYYVSDDGQTTSQQFEFYQNYKNSNLDKWTSLQDVQIGAQVIGYGTITKFGSTEPYTYEFNKNNYLVSYVAPENPKTTATITLSGYTTTLSADDAADEVTIAYNGDGELSATSSNTGVATAAIVNGKLVVTPVAAGGPITITVSAPETDEYTAASKSYNLTVTAGLTAAALPFTFDGGQNDINPANGIKANGLGSNYSSSPKLKFDGDGDYVLVKIASKAAQVSYSIKGNPNTGDWSGQFDVLESADGTVYTSVVSHTTLAKSAEKKTHDLLEETRYVKFVLTTKSNGNVALGAINIVATKPKVDPTFSIANVDVTVDGNAELQITTNSDGAVTYTIDPDNSGIEITDGTVYAHAAGTYTVTANKAATETYNAAQTTFTVTVSSVAYKTAEVSTFTAVNGGLLELGQFHSYKGDAGTAPAINNNHIRLYQNGGYITISALPGLKIAKIDISTAQSTLYNYKVDAAEDYTLTEAASLAKDATANLAGLIADSVRIYCLGTDKNSRFDVSYLKVYYTGELETVSALAVDGATKTEYEIGETVNHSGAVVTATFENAGAVDVTLNSTFTDPDMSTPGTKQVTAEFAEQTATYDITVKAETPEITVDVASVPFGTVLKDAETAAKTVAVTLTAITNATVAVTGEGKDAFNVTPTSLTESGNITITPVTTAAGEFAATITISADGAESKTIALSMTVSDGDLDKETVDFTEVYSDVTGSSSVEFAGYNGITFSLAVAKNDGTQPKYYANGSAVRAYAKNTITISSSKTIAFVLIEHTGKSYQDTEATVDKGTLKVNDAYSMWTLDATSGTITLANTIRFDKITVYYKYDEAIRTNLSVGQIGTICQGKNILAVKGAVLYNVEFGTTQEITLKEITEFPIAAGTPAIFQAEAVDFEVIYGSQTATEAVVDGYDGLVGLLQGEVQGDRELIEEGNILVSGGKLRLVGANCYLTAGHAYIKMSEVSPEQPTSPAPGRRLVLTNDEAQVVTGLNALQVSGKTRKMMMNNQMVIIREGKMYNATGALMK